MSLLLHPHYTRTCQININSNIKIKMFHMMTLETGGKISHEVVDSLGYFFKALSSYQQHSSRSQNICILQTSAYTLAVMHEGSHKFVKSQQTAAHNSYVVIIPMHLMESHWTVAVLLGFNNVNDTVCYKSNCLNTNHQQLLLNH